MLAVAALLPATLIHLRFGVKTDDSGAEANGPLAKAQTLLLSVAPTPSRTPFPGVAHMPVDILMKLIYN